MTTLWEQLTKKRFRLTPEQEDELDKIEQDEYFRIMKVLRKRKGEEKAKEDARDGRRWKKIKKWNLNPKSVKCLEVILNDRDLF